MPMQGVQPLADIFPCFLIVSRNRKDGIRNKLYESIKNPDQLNTGTRYYDKPLLLR